MTKYILAALLLFPAARARASEAYTNTANLSNVSGTLPVANGGTGATTAAAARTALGTAASGANADITSLTAPLQVGAGTNVDTFTALGDLQAHAGFTLNGSSISLTSVDTSVGYVTVGGVVNLIVNDNSTQNGGMLFTINGTTTSGMGLWYKNSTGDGYIENRFGSGSTAGGLIFRTQTTAGATPIQALRIDGQGNSSFGNGATVSTFTTTGSLNLAAGASLQQNSVVLFSSVPVYHVSGSVIVGTLASGTTFMAFTPDAAITLTRVSAVVEVAGVSGSGDVVKCNNAAGTGISVTLSAAATAGTYATATGTAAIAYQGVVSCHIDSGAATRPILTAVLEYVMQ